MKIRTIIFGLGTVAVLGGGGYYVGSLAGHNRGGSPGAGGPPGMTMMTKGDTGPISVTASAVERKNVPVLLTGIGTAIAFNSVAVKARVDGQLTEVRFKEGQDVKVGDVLAVIDQRSYVAAMKQAQATLEKDRSQLANSKLDLERSINLKEFASRQTVDTAKATVAQLDAQVSADQALIDTAKVNLDYTTITSPIAGRTGIRGVDVGNIVHSGDTTQIVTISQIEPVSVVFTLPADDLPQVRRGADAGTLKVYAYSKDNTTLLAEGELALYDNQIDSTTATVKLKATFSNKNHALWPGQFVNARLLVETLHDGLVVPANVVQHGPSTTYAWVIDADNKVSMRTITVQQTQDNQALISSGLKPGERVVVDGQYKLQSGSTVDIATPGSGAGPA